MSVIQMNLTSVLSVPLQNYAKDFSFIVNGEEIKTSSIVSDIISPNICKIHSLDPTVNTFIINTKHSGDFSHVIKLVDFNQINITDDELEFFVEVIEILGNQSIMIHKLKEEEINNDNVFQQIKKHEKFKRFYSDLLSKEIEYISSHFYELCEIHKEDLSDLHIDTLFNILSSSKLHINSEDQLIEFVNELYSKNSEYSILYEPVQFVNVSIEKIRKFLEIYDFNELTTATWIGISARLEKELKEKVEMNDRYEKQGMQFSPDNKNNNPFSGIINYLHSQSNGQIENEIEITVSSCGESTSSYQPMIVIANENKPNYFYSKDTPDSWLCLDFKNNKIIPTDYTIRSGDLSQNSPHMKNWVFEGSVDKNDWDVLDAEKDCPHLNNRNAIYTFHLDHQKIKSKWYRYFRIKETGQNWHNNNYLSFNRIEIYGTLIQ